MFIVSNSTSKAATDCRGRGSSQCLLLVNPHQKQLQTWGGEGELPVFVVSKSTSKAGTDWGEGELPVFIVSNSTSKAATDCRGRWSSQCLLLVNPHQKQVQTGGRGSS